MKKHIKLVLLIIIALCLSGCGEEEYQEYLDAIGNGVTCTYYPYGENKYSDSINSVTFSATKKGLDIIYKVNGASVTNSFIEVTFNNNGEFKNIKENKSHKVGSYTFDYSSFDYQNYFNLYRTNKSCPQNIYLSETYGKMQFYETRYAELSDSVTYTFTTSNTGGNNGNNNCTNPDADNCETYDKETYLDGPVTIELGRANGREYVTVSTASNTNSEAKYSDGESRPINVGSYTYMVMGRDWDALFIGDSSYASDIYLDEVVLGGQNTIHITVEGSETIEEYSQFSSVEESLPPGTGYNDREETGNTEQEPLPVTEIKFCEQNGVRMTFRVIGYVLFIAKILIPLLLIILGTIDFVKATLSSSDKAPQEALGAFARRIIIAIIIFLIPTILNLVLSLVDGASEAFEDSKFTDCTNCLFSPFDKCDVENMSLSQ